jgi:xylulokinase
MSAPYLLGLDLGISSLKAALFTAEGQLVHVEQDEYMIYPEGDRVEVDPQVYWTPMARAIRHLLERWGGPPEAIAAVSVSSHAETVIPMTADGQPARKALVWMDNRSQPEADELLAQMGLRRVLEISGQPDIGPIWPVTKFRWLSKHEPETVQRTAAFLLPEDYILFRLSGKFAGEYSLWSSSLVLDIRRKVLSEEMLTFAGISAHQIPPLYPSGTAIGTVCAACAAETGLSTRTVVVTGAIDQACAAIAAGNVRPGIVTESTGSVLALVATIPEPIFDAETRVPCHIHALPDMYCLLPWNTTGGLTLKWFKDYFALDLSQRAEASGQDVYTLLTEAAADIAPGSDGLIMLPHLEGAFFPEYNHQARGVFFGFTLSHTRAHFTRAILEAVAYMIRRDLEGLARLGVSANELRVLGGGAKSKLWSQIKADVCNLPVVMPSHGEAAVLGAAMLAAVGIGLVPDIPSAANLMVKEGERLYPNPAAHGVYEAAYRLYVNLYEKVKDLYPDCSAIQNALPR